jgi:hypothetical protein
MKKSRKEISTSRIGTQGKITSCIGSEEMPVGLKKPQETIGYSPREETQEILVSFD